MTEAAERIAGLTLTRHASLDDLVGRATARIAAALRNGIAARGRTSLALSGGATPEPIYARLGEATLAWDKVGVTLVDERWAPPTAAESNERMVLRSLFAGGGGAADFVPLWRSDTTPDQAAQTADNDLDRLPMPFDVVVLGLGEDGHMASLFPSTPSLEVGLDPTTPRRVIATEGPTGPRLSLTLPTILNARLILLVVTGGAKMRTLETAMQGSTASAMPVRAVLQQTMTPVEVAWAP